MLNIEVLYCLFPKSSLNLFISFFVATFYNAQALWGGKMWHTTIVIFLVRMRQSYGFSCMGIDLFDALNHLYCIPITCYNQFELEWWSENWKLIDVDAVFQWCRENDEEKEYLVKYKELSYDECYWEFESDISAFQPEIDKFHKIQSRSRKSSNKNKSIHGDVGEVKKKQKEFQQYDCSPEFLSGGT